MIELLKLILGGVNVLLIPVPFVYKPSMGNREASCFMLSDVVALLCECS